MSDDRIGRPYVSYYCKILDFFKVTSFGNIALKSWYNYKDNLMGMPFSVLDVPSLSNVYFVGIP